MITGQFRYFRTSAKRELCLVNHLTVYDGGVSRAADGGQRIRSPDDHVAVLSGLQRTDPVTDAGLGSGIDGDGPPAFLVVQACVDCQTCAHGQVLQGDNRGVGDDADGDAGLVQRCGGGETLAGQLDLRLAAQGGADESGEAFLGQLVSNHSAVGAMIHGHLQAEFFGDPDGGENVVAAVGVALQRDLALHHRDHGFHLHIKAGVLAGFLVLQVTLGLEQGLPQHGGGTHTGHGGALGTLAVAPLGIFAESALHSQRELDDHIVDPLAHQLDGDEGAADDIGAAGAGAGGGHAAADGVGEGFVQGIDGVDGPHLGSHGVDDLVVILAFPAGCFVVQTNVAMGVHAARGHQTALSVDDFTAFGCGDVGTDSGDLTLVVDENAAVRNVTACHGLDVTVFDQKHMYALL